MNQRIRKILLILEDLYAGSETALIYDSPFQLLIATMLAAQSTDKRVNIVTQILFKDYSTAAEISRISVSQLEEYIRTVGLYKSKAKNILLTSKIIAEKYNGDIPATRSELMELPGVGRKTANVVLSIARKVPAIAVDTHVFRVSNRLGLANAANVEKTEEQLMKVIPKKKWSEAHHWLIWHGRKICKARNPDCKHCPLVQYCAYTNKNLTL
ncbi:MAG: endonuclease III [Calditrichaeota bacterium]|nr:MAG: endonuclease III [Calditrichota bacterium]